MVGTFELVATYSTAFLEDVLELFVQESGECPILRVLAWRDSRFDNRQKFRNGVAALVKPDGQEVENVQKGNGRGADKMSSLVSIVSLVMTTTTTTKMTRDYVPKEVDEENYSSSPEDSEEDPGAYNSNEEFYSKDSKEAQTSR